MARLTDGPWAWLKFGDRWHLIANWGPRRVILTRAETCGVDGALEPATPTSPDMRLLAKSREMFDLLEEIEADQWTRPSVRDKIRDVLSGVR